MPGSAPRFASVYTMHPAPRLVAAAAVRRRATEESNGVLVAVACVVAAMLLYLAGTMVYGFGENDESVSLGAIRSSGATMS